ncbi:MAG: BLUF domain-containing protein [Alphaproteobacteria bacterium]
MLDSLIYLSSAARLLTPQELQDLLAISRRNNARAGIGGILLYWDGNFLQYIEGPREQINLLMTKLAADPLHGGIIVLQRQEIAERAFPDWTMAFEMIKGAGDGQSDYLSDGLLSAAPETLSPTARRLIDIFREQLR